MTAILHHTKPEDDFGQPITGEPGEVLYDAPTVHRGTWATMTQASWEYHRRSPKLGTGYGQKYQRGADGVLRKVEG